jgi:hypothetical protein
MGSWPRRFGTSGDAAMNGNVNEKHELGQDRSDCSESRKTAIRSALRDKSDPCDFARKNRAFRAGRIRLPRVRRGENPIAPNIPDYPIKPKCPVERCRNTTRKDLLFPHLANCRTVGMT